MGLWERLDRAVQHAFDDDGPSPAPQPAEGRPTGDLRLFAPCLLRRPLTLARRETVEGRLVETWQEMGWVPMGSERDQWGPVHSYCVVPLARPLPLLHVGNDLFDDPKRYVACGPVPVPTPADLDPHDGKTWRVHAASADYARAVLTTDAWDLLAAVGDRSRFGWWIDGSHLVAAGNHPAVDDLVRFAALVDELAATGALDRWPTGPDPSALPDLGLWPGTDWQVSAPSRLVLLWLQDQWPMRSYDLEVTGTVDGGPFTAVRRSIGLSGPPYALAERRGNLDAGVVMVPLQHAVPDHVHVARRRLPGGGIGTEWLDFDDDYRVRARDERIGHEVTTPRLMEFLYDHRVRQLAVRGSWVYTSTKPFTTDRITALVRVLSEARDLLPGYAIESRATAAAPGPGPDSVPVWPPRPGTR